MKVFLVSVLISAVMSDTKLLDPDYENAKSRAETFNNLPPNLRTKLQEWNPKDEEKDTISIEEIFRFGDKYLDLDLVGRPFTEKARKEYEENFLPKREQFFANLCKEWQERKRINEKYLQMMKLLYTELRTFGLQYQRIKKQDKLQQSEIGKKQKNQK